MGRSRVGSCASVRSKRRSAVGFEVNVMDASDPSLLLAGFSKESVELFGVVAKEDRLHKCFLKVALGHGRTEGEEGEYNEGEGEISSHLFKDFIKGLIEAIDMWSPLFKGERKRHTICLISAESA